MLLHTARSFFVAAAFSSALFLLPARGTLLGSSRKAPAPAAAAATGSGGFVLAPAPPVPPCASAAEEYPLVVVLVLSDKEDRTKCNLFLKATPGPDFVPLQESGPFHRRSAMVVDLDADSREHYLYAASTTSRKASRLLNADNSAADITQVLRDKLRRRTTSTRAENALFCSTTTDVEGEEVEKTSWTLHLYHDYGARAQLQRAEQGVQVQRWTPPHKKDPLVRSISDEICRVRQKREDQAGSGRPHGSEDSDSESSSPPSTLSSSSSPRSPYVDGSGMVVWPPSTWTSSSSDADENEYEDDPAAGQDDEGVAPKSEVSQVLATRLDQMLGVVTDRPGVAVGPHREPTTSNTMLWPSELDMQRARLQRRNERNLRLQQQQDRDEALIAELLLVDGGTPGEQRPDLEIVFFDGVEGEVPLGLPSTGGQRTDLESYRSKVLPDRHRVLFAHVRLDFAEFFERVFEAKRCAEADVAQRKTSQQDAPAAQPGTRHDLERDGSKTNEQAIKNRRLSDLVTSLTDRLAAHGQKKVRSRSPSPANIVHQMGALRLEDSSAAKGPSGRGGSAAEAPSSHTSQLTSAPSSLFPQRVITEVETTVGKAYHDGEGEMIPPRETHEVQAMLLEGGGQEERRRAHIVALGESRRRI